MKNTWIESSNNYYLREISNQVGDLPVAVYKTEMNPNTGELYLARTSDKFEMPSKVYGFEESLIRRVVKTYRNTNGNLGVLLNGQKGTGKTVTGKLICNTLRLPVIIVTGKFPNLPGFLNDLQQDVIIFFDEYEKIYNNYDHTVLTVMDGVLDTQYRKLFLLTTNELHVNANMLQRPGRIRYFKTFGDLSFECIQEIIDDLLVHKHHSASVEKFISELEIITVDIVKAVIQEVNIHDEAPDNFADVFNVRKVDNVFNVYQLQNEGGKLIETLRYSKVNVSPMKLSKKSVGKYLNVGGLDIGIIREINSDGVISLEFYGDNETTGEMEKGKNSYKKINLKVEKTFHIHRSFSAGSFVY